MLFKQSQRTLRQGLVLSLIAPALFACSKSKFSTVQSAPVEPVQQTYSPRPDPNYRPPTYTPPPPPPTYQPPPQQQSDCNDYTYPAPAYEGPKAVHVLVALDGSKSNVEERYRQLSGLVKAYSSVVARNIPIKVALITGHSPESTDSALFGNLFYENQVGRGGEPDVIVFNAGPTDNDTAYRWLYDKIMKMRTDNSHSPTGISGGGELLLVNTLAVLNDQRLQQLMGMSRGDILNIHFLADENDACTIGTVESDVPNASTILPSERGMQREIIARNRHCISDKYANQLDASNPSHDLVNVLGQSLTYSYDMQVNNDGHGYSERLYSRIEQLSSFFKIHMSAFVYTTQPPRVNENEIGHGYIDLIQALDQGGVKGSVFDLNALTNDQSVYLAGSSVVNAMNENMYSRVQLTDANGQPLDTSSMDYQRSQVFVVNAAGQSTGQPIEYRRSNTNGYIDVRRGCPIQQNYNLRVRYCRQRTTGY